MGFWRVSREGWAKYNKKPTSQGRGFEEKNPEILPQNDDKKIIYLHLSDSYLPQIKPTRYMDIFNRDIVCSKRYKIDDMEFELSESTEKGTRYAVLPFEQELFDKLNAENLHIREASNEDRVLPAENLNVLVLW